MAGGRFRYHTSFIIVANAQKEKPFNKIAIKSGDTNPLLCARRRRMQRKDWKQKGISFIIKRYGV
jgi:hypothetical protein